MADLYLSAAGRHIYTFSVRAFAGLIANIYLIDDGDQLILVDCGSGRDESNRHLHDGFASLREKFGVSFSLADVDLIIITHGHIDHFGGLPFVRQQTNAPIGVHILDRRVLSHYEERVVVAAQRLDTFLNQAGIKAGQRRNLMQMYLYAKNVYRSTAVQFTLQEGKRVAGINVYEVPGHSPGLVCLQVDDILLTADHILAHTTPHQAPESITLNTGLNHYLASLEKISRVDGIRLALGGHEAPIEDVYSRIKSIERFHQQRLERILDICAEPRSVADISHALFGEVDGYHVLLALEEAGAHVEYLYLRGELTAVNAEEIAEKSEPVFLYRRL